MPEHKSQGETVRIFTLIISEIAARKVQLSSAHETGDMSDIGGQEEPPQIRSK